MLSLAVYRKNGRVFIVRRGFISLIKVDGICELMSESSRDSNRLTESTNHPRFSFDVEIKKSLSSSSAQIPPSLSEAHF